MGTQSFFNGTYDDFLEKIGWESEETKPKVETKKLSEKEIKQKRAELTIERAKQTKPIKEEIERLESEITKNEDLLKRINGELEKATIANDTAKLTDYAHAVGKLNHMIDELFEKLTNSNESLEFILAKYDKELEALS